MNQQLFDIVKAMQAIGITATKFAHACKVEYHLMARAFMASNYQQFMEGKGSISNIFDGDLGF